jgi:hypothetical protein
MLVSNEADFLGGASQRDYEPLERGMVKETIKSSVLKGLEAAYKDGHSDGYEAGYRAGREDYRREHLALFGGKSASSEVKPRSKRRGRPPSDTVTGPAIVREWLRKFGKGTAGQIVDHMREQSELAAHFKNNPYWGHSTLGRMVHRGYLIRDGKYYRLNPDKDQSHLRLVTSA